MKKSHLVFFRRPVAWTHESVSVAMATLTIILLACSATAASVFTLTNTALPGVAYSSVVCGNFNNDGKPDVLLTGANVSFNGICQVWRSQTNGVFTNFTAAFPGISTNAVTSSAVAQGDFDNDGRPDFLITGFAGVDGNSSPVFISQVWRNLGNGSFTNMNVGLPGVYQSSAAFADYDNDGKLDILFAGVNSQSNLICQVWRNTGNWVFTNIVAGLPGIRSGSVAWADFDNDGRLDPLLSGLDTNSNPILHVYHNNTVSNNTFALRITTLKTLANRSQHLSFGGQAGFGYTVWASTNLVHWTALGVPNESGAETFQFTDLSATNLRCRLYRLSRP